MSIKGPYSFYGQLNKSIYRFQFKANGFEYSPLKFFKGNFFSPILVIVIVNKELSLIIERAEQFSIAPDIMYAVVIMLYLMPIGL